MSSNATGKRNHTLGALIRCIIVEDGVLIDGNDIEKIIDIYERIIKTMSDEGCDNTRTLNCKIDPYATIDFTSLGEEGIASLKNFVMGIDELKTDEEDELITKADLSPSTKEALLTGNNIVAVLRHVQDFMHFIGGFAMQVLEDHDFMNYVNFRFSSRTHPCSLEITATTPGDGTIDFHYFNNTLINKL